MRSPILVPSGRESAGNYDRRWRSNSPKARSECQRDRDRILYCSAFKRLAHVTQVTTSEAGFTFHSRLTHSLKVAQFARRLAERLRASSVGYVGAAARVTQALDVDAAEAAALAHDIGHPPFGHLAEEELNLLGAGFGGFEGNAQTFRILTRLALRSQEHQGLNLTRCTLNGVIKYPWLRSEEDPKRGLKWNAYTSDREEFEWVRDTANGPERSIEAEIMDWADDVTYAVHDMDDFYRAGLVPLERLCQGGPELVAFQDHLRRAIGGKEAEPLCAVAEQIFRKVLSFDARYSGSAAERIELRAAGSGLITRYIEAPTVEALDDKAVFVVDDQLRHEVDVLKHLIWFYVIERPSLAIMQSGHRRVIRELFERYREAAVKTDGQRLFPTLYAERLGAANTPEAKQRIVIDLISSMTEAGALEVYRRLTGIVGASINDLTGRL